MNLPKPKPAINIFCSIDFVFFNYTEMNNKPKSQNNEIAHYVFSGSTTMIGVCITVIALFKVMNTNLKTYADEILGVDTFIFIFAAFFSYLTLRNDKNKSLEKFADLLFFTGMSILILVGVIIVFSTY